MEPSGQVKVTDTSVIMNTEAVQHLVLCSKGSGSLFLQLVRERIDYNGNSELILDKINAAMRPYRCFLK